MGFQGLSLSGVLRGPGSRTGEGTEGVSGRTFVGGERGMGVGNTNGGGAGAGRTMLPEGRQASSVPIKVAKENTASLRKNTPVLLNPPNRKFAKLCIHPELPSWPTGGGIYRGSEGVSIGSVAATAFNQRGYEKLLDQARKMAPNSPKTRHNRAPKLSANSLNPAIVAASAIFASFARFK